MTVSGDTVDIEVGVPNLRRVGLDWADRHGQLACDLSGGSNSVGESNDGDRGRQKIGGEVASRLRFFAR